MTPTVSAVPHLPLRPYLRGWSHAVAFIAAVALCPILIVFRPEMRAAAAIYAAAMIGLFGISAAYHCVAWGTRAHGLFRRLDHAMIFITIAATYTPVSLALGSTGGTAVMVVVWTAAGLGALSQLAWPGAPPWLTASLYLAVGWSAVVVLDDIWRYLGIAGFILLLVGGLLHSAGAVIYATQRPNPWPRWFGFHEIFHLLVIGAIASHYVVVAFFALPRGA